MARNIPMHACISFLLRGIPGAIDSFMGKLNISGNAVFSWNTAPDAGGAIAVAQPRNLSINGATFTSNQATYGYGGAVSVDANGDDPLAFGNLAFDNNSAGTDGGAIFLFMPSRWSDMWNTTFYRNTAGMDGVGDRLFRSIFLRLKQQLLLHLSSSSRESRVLAKFEKPALGGNMNVVTLGMCWEVQLLIGSIQNGTVFAATHDATMPRRCR